MATSTVPVTRTGKAGSSIFLKTVMAGTGIIFVLYVLAHMYGNLKLFAGERSYNEYAEHIRTIGEPMLPHRGLLTLIEIVLALSLVGHVVSASMLWKRAKAARPQAYAVKKRVGGSFSSHWMRWGGLTLLLFIIWHVIQFTMPKVNVGKGGQSADIVNNPFQLVVSSFNVWWLTLIYLLAMVALGMHLHHGIWSASQTLGFTNTAKSRRIAKVAGAILGLVVSVGFILPPLFILFGVIK